MNDRPKRRPVSEAFRRIEAERVERLARGGEIEGRGLGALIPSGPCIFPPVTAAHAGLIEAAARAEEERTRAAAERTLADLRPVVDEYAAGVESAMQAARWAIPVDLAIAATEEVLQYPGALPFDGLTISGDHRPREPRHYDPPFLQPPSALWAWIMRNAPSIPRGRMRP